MNKALKRTLSLVMTLLLLVGCVSAALAVESYGTSTEYRYENKFWTAKLFYGDFALISEEYCPIPGLQNTDVRGSSCTCMTPQGLCVSEEFIFISAYCNVKTYKSELEENIGFGSNADKLAREENHEKHNSVIYIIDRKSGEYIKNMVLPDSNHVGGLAFDGENIYVAKSTDAKVSIITLKQIEKVLATKSMSVEVEYEYTVDCGSTASFVTYHDGLLWVGVFDEKNPGSLNGFTVDERTFKLSKAVSVEIPAKANGACFTELDGEICLAVNSSYGRKNISKIYLYSVSDYGTAEIKLKQKDRFNAPPTVQNSCVFDGKVYYIYESAATCYSEVDSLFDTKSTTCAIDRVCIGDARRLFNWHCEENLFMLKVENIFNSFASLLTAVFN